LTLAAPVADGSAVNVAPVTGAGASVAPSLNLASPVATSSGNFGIADAIGTASAIAPTITLTQPEASGAGVYADFVQITPNVAFKVAAQPRAFSVTFDDRAFRFAAQPRSFVVTFDDRAFAVPSQSRVFRVLKGTL